MCNSDSRIIHLLKHVFMQLGKSELQSEGRPVKKKERKSWQSIQSNTIWALATQRILKQMKPN